MTCIAGVSDGKDVWIGGDSLGVCSSTYEMTFREDEKVFFVKEFLIGFTTSFRMGQLLRYFLNVGEPEKPYDPLGFMVRQFIPAVRQCLKDGGFASKKDEQESGGTFLVGYRGKLFRIENDYQVNIPKTGYDAIGCGSHFALGSLFTFKDENPEFRVQRAIEAVMFHSSGVGGSISVLSTKSS